MDFSNIEVTIDHIADAGAKIKAYATVTFDGMFKVHGVRLAESKQGLNIPHHAAQSGKCGQAVLHWKHEYIVALSTALSGGL